MGIFSRIASAIGGAIERVGDVVDRVLLGAEETVVAVVDKTDTTVSEALDAASDFASSIFDFGDGKAAADERAEFAETLGPILDEDPADRTLDEIELEQWRSLLEEYEEQLPPNFIDALFSYIKGESYDLDDDWLSVVDMEAPDGDTGEAAA